mgnify:CR=1 FL=1
MASKVTVDPGKLTRFSAKVLQKVGVPAEDAERTASMLVAAAAGLVFVARLNASEAGIGANMLLPAIAAVRLALDVSAVQMDAGVRKLGSEVTLSLEVRSDAGKNRPLPLRIGDAGQVSARLDELLRGGPVTGAPPRSVWIDPADCRQWMAARISSRLVVWVRPCNSALRGSNE